MKLPYHDSRAVLRRERATAFLIELLRQLDVAATPPNVMAQLPVLAAALAVQLEAAEAERT